MKKIVFLLSAILIFSHSSFAQDKAFKRGKITISIGAGLGIYGTKTHHEQNQTVYSGGTLHTERVVKDTTGGAGAGVFPLTVEFGLTNWLGVGARLGFSKYIANADSTNKNIKPTVSGLDEQLLVNLHFVKTKHFDMPLQLTVGYSNLKYRSNDVKASMAKGGGLTYGFALVPRIYFGEHIGMFFNLGYTGFKYPDMKFSDSSNSSLNADSGDLKYNLSASGVNAGLGLVVKFL